MQINHEITWNRNMDLDDFVRNNYSYFEEMYTEDYPHMDVKEADLAHIYRDTIKELMVEQYKQFVHSL